MSNGGRKHFPSSLRNRIIFIFLCIVIVPFLLFAYYSHIKSIEGISNTNMKMTMSYLYQAKRNFEMYLTKLNSQINELVGNKQLQELLDDVPGSIEEEEALAVHLLALLYQNTPAIDAFRVKLYPVRPSSYPAYMSTIGESGKIEQEYWFQRSRLTVSPSWYLMMPKEGQYAKPLLTYVKRFTGLYDLEPRGLIVTDLSEDYLARYFSPFEQLSNQKLLLLNEDGVVYYDSAQNEWTGQPFPSASFVKFMLTGVEGSQSVTISGTTYLATYIRLDSQSWSMVSLTPLNELTETTDEMNRALVLFLVVYLLCCIGFMFYITVRFTQPIAHLVRLMRKLEADNLHYLLPSTTRKDEVGMLYGGVANLFRRIEKLIQEASLSERKKKALEFQVLSHQINPHFLYNTLETIRWKAENHGRNDIGEMVSALGNLLRLSLNQGKEITTLRREIEQVKAYVQIEQARMGQVVHIFYFCDNELLDLPFLRLLLQPLVENAIQHSVREDFQRGKIVVDARRDGNSILIGISDNGRGIPPEVIERLEREESDSVASSAQLKGVGLRNVNERLKLYFGETCKLRIESGPDKGTKITFRHPVLQEGQDLSLYRESPGKRREREEAVQSG
ncbi:histidine kinase [Paenibacillus sp. 32O-W]|uniref:cache domain-containing sensor histidine kinase n=1 Tax=Paenibacillus sp. 32O-W TaxID=1695218 RepID=UPI0007222BD9|nr:histidine kinase [Paenibacillus sp. 32O-W]ALS29222.1 histidine kinase [Paenibacillus sp. 32O-W]